MDKKELFEELKDLAKQVGFELRQVPLAGSGGGFCRLKGHNVIFIDIDDELIEQINMIAQALSNVPEIEEIYVRPEIREIIEKHGDSGPTR